MTLRTAAEYRAALADDRHVEIDGRRIESLSIHPAFSGIVHSVEQYYERRADPQQQTLLTVGADSQSRRCRAYHVPCSADDLRETGRMIEFVARESGGTTGRMPDYVPLVVAGLLDAASLIGSEHPIWRDNIEQYHRYCSSADLFLAHSFADRQINRSLRSDELPHLGYEPGDDGGIVVNGIKAVATSAPIADEFLVLTPPRAGLGPHQALFFALPVATPGLRFVCRPSLAMPNEADHPLSARFDEVDCWAIFEDVKVPAARQFLTGDVALVRKSWRHLLTLAYYHILIRLSVKADLFLGVSSLIARYLGVDSFEEVRIRLADMARHVETLRAFVRAAEASCITTRSGMTMPDPGILSVGHMHAVEYHHRLVEMLVAIAGQSILMAPTSAAVAGGDGLTPGAGDDDEVRRRVFRLGWDLAASGFAGRQYLFEQFNGRDLTRNRQAFIERYDLEDSQSLALQIALGEKRPRRPR